MSAHSFILSSLAIFEMTFIHSLGNAETATEPWMYPDMLPYIRAALAFRYRLIPYLYTLLFETAHSGAPMIRPLVYHFQQDLTCCNESFDFMLGPNLLVAPVLEPGMRSRKVYLPAGRWWCDFFTGQWYTGGQSIEVPAPLEHIPLFVPDGGIIPTGKPMRHIGEQPDDLRRVYVFPHPMAGAGEFSLVEDDGISLAYQEGRYAGLRLMIKALPSRVALGIDITAKGYELPYSSVEFVFPPGEKRDLETKSGDEYTDADARRCLVVPLE